MSGSRGGLQVGSRGGTRIRVVGVGGAGCSAIDRMIDSGLQEAAFLAIDTDTEALDRSQGAERLQIGARLAGGLGAAGDTDLARRAALEDSIKIIRALTGAEVVFVVAGMGGGTGTGAAPVVASLAREMRALTVAAVTKPFASEGGGRRARAEQGLAALRKSADSVIVIPNQEVRTDARREANDTSFEAAYGMLLRAVRGLYDIVTIPGVLRGGFALRMAMDQSEHLGSESGQVVKALAYEEVETDSAEVPDTDLAEFRALLADLTREYAASGEEFATEAADPMPSDGPAAAVHQSNVQRSNVQRAAARAYAEAALSPPEPEPVAPVPTVFAQLLQQRLGATDEVADFGDVPSMAAEREQATTADAAMPPEPAFGQRFRATRRAMGRGAKVR